MAPHSRTLAWRIPGMEEPGRLQSMDGVTKSWTRLHFHFSLSCIGEGNGNPLQCSCLENPRDGRLWWAAVYGVAQSRPRLKWLSSSRGEKSPWKEICQLGLKKTTPTKENANRGKKHYGDIYFYIFMTINRAMVISPTQPFWRPVENLTQVGRQNGMSPGDHKFIYSHAFCKLWSIIEI